MAVLQSKIIKYQTLNNEYLILKYYLRCKRFLAYFKTYIERIEFEFFFYENEGYF